jgi:hypothetical protein
MHVSTVFDDEMLHRKYSETDRNNMDDISDATVCSVLMEVFKGD